MTTNANPTPIPSPSAHPAGASHGPSLSLTIPSRYRGADPLVLRVQDAEEGCVHLVAGIDRMGEFPWMDCRRAEVAARLRAMADALDPAPGEGFGRGGYGR